MTFRLAILLFLFGSELDSLAIATREVPNDPASPVELISTRRSSPVVWKPSTHVFLAMEALKEIFDDTDLLGNAKPVGLVPIYRVRYKMPSDVDVYDPTPDDRIIERIGLFELHPDLAAALREETESYLAGVVGPDAYPDIATGQQRVHVHVEREAFRDVPSDAWFRYLWTAVLAENPGGSASPSERTKYLQKLAFVAGYLTHAAGDMYMHTFINLFAGGPFSVAGTTNGVRHIVAEGYVGKRTPDLDDLYNELKDLGLNTGNDVFRPTLSQNVFDFIYRHMVDAVPGTTLGDEILVDINPILESFDPSVQTSFPRFMSTLKYGLIADTTSYRETLDDFDDQIENAPNPGVAAVLIGKRLAFVALNEPRVAYARNWIDDIESGLRAWPEFNHKVMQGLTLSRDGIDRDEIMDAVDEYKLTHLLSMLGSPDLTGEVLGFIAAYEQLIFPDEYRDAIADWRDNFVDTYLLSHVGLSLEQIEDLYKNPELSFNPIVNTPDPTDPDGVPPLLISLTDYNHDYLYIDDDGYQDPSKRIKTFFFQPAFNTITATKLLFMDPTAIGALQAAVCDPTEACEPVESNAMLGFINSLDFDNEFRLEGGIYDDNGQTPPRGAMPFVGCNAYRELFMEQAGELNPCRVRLATPDISPRDGSFDTPTEITIDHPDPLANVLYAIVDSDNLPINHAAIPFRAYAGPFTLAAPLTGTVRPWIVYSKATRAGYDSSELDSVAITIDAGLTSPTYFPQTTAHTTLVNVTLSGPNGSTLFYTINGEDPTYNSTRYAGPIALGIGTHTIRATAYRIGYTQSPIVTKTYTVYTPDAARVADPVFEYGSFSGFTESVTVNVSSTTRNAEVRYEVAKDQVPPIPTEASDLFSQPFQLGIGNWFIRAIAFRNGLPESNLVQVNYNVNEPLGVTLTPTFSPPAGVYHNDVEVSIAAATDPATAGVQVFYSTDGNSPPTSPVIAGNYKSPFTVATSTTVKAQAVRSFFPMSVIASARYTLQAAPPVITPAGASSAEPIIVELSSETEAAEIRYTLDGTEPNEGSLLYDQPISIGASSTLKARAIRSQYEHSDITSAEFVITPDAAPVFDREPVSVAVVEGQSFQLVGHATGSPQPTIAWIKDGQPLRTSPGDTLTISDATLSDAGLYQARATNSVAQTLSRGATVSIAARPVAPKIIRQPADRTVDQDSSAFFTVEVSGTPSPGLRWQRNGLTLTAQTGPSLVFERASIAMAGEYRVIAMNEAGVDTSRTVSLTVVVATGLESMDSDLPNQFSLDPNFPNPASNSTRIPFSLREPSDTSLELFDVQGRRLAILVDQHLAAGVYEVDFDVSELASGIYYYRLVAGDFKDTGRLTVVR